MSLVRKANLKMGVETVLRVQTLRCDLKILTGGVRAPGKPCATTYNLSNPAPGENLLSWNRVMETGCMAIVSKRRSYSFVRIQPRCRLYLDYRDWKANCHVWPDEHVWTTFRCTGCQLIEAIDTLLNSRNDDLARRLVNVKETAVKKEASRLKGRQLLWTVYED